MWQLNTKKHLKIWFSSDSEQFLGIENELRLIKDREKNQSAQFTFLYSSKCLSRPAHGALKKFCETHRIIPLDFDTQLRSKLCDPQDVALYEKAKREIRYTTEDKGGNLAAASDCARLIVPLLERAGIYSDFDVKINFSKKPPLVTVKAPLLLQAEILDKDDKVGYSFNNEVIAAAVDPLDNSKLSQDAIEHLRLVQKEVLKRYEKPVKWLLLSSIKGFSDPFKDFPEVASVLTHYFKTHDHDIFAYRKYLKTLSIEDFFHSQPLGRRKEIWKWSDLSKLKREDLHSRLAAFLRSKNEDNAYSMISTDNAEQCINRFLKLVRFDLLLNSVAHLSGPAAFSCLVQPSVPKKGFGNFTKIATRDAWQVTGNLIRQHGFTGNQLANCITSSNTQQNKDALADQDVDVLDAMGTLGDQSWMLEGAQKKQEREQAMKEAALLIEKAWLAQPKMLLRHYRRMFPKPENRAPQTLRRSKRRL